MRVWLVNPWEPNPLDAADGRLWRTGLTASRLHAEGHDVVWWASNFAHVAKKFRLPEPDTVVTEHGFRIRVIPALGYRRNISLARLRDHQYVAERFAERAEAEDAPDVILASLPTIDLAEVAAEYGQAHGIPVVIDVRDQWPDTFYDVFPKALHWLVGLATSRMSRRANRALRSATALTSHGPGSLSWALERAGRPKSDLDRAFPMGYPTTSFSQEDLRAARETWARRGFDEDSDRFVVAFLGTIGRHFDFRTLIDAARALDATARPVHFVFCGVGEELEAHREETRDLPNVHFPGWVEAAEIQALLRLSSLGVAPYHEGDNFEGGITNKPVEYLSAGLPIATTLARGVLHDTLARADCGVFYGVGDAPGLVDELVGLQDDPARLARMSANASELFHSEFTAEKVYGEVATHLEAVVDRFHAVGKTA